MNKMNYFVLYGFLFCSLLTACGRSQQITETNIGTTAPADITIIQSEEPGSETEEENDSHTDGTADSEMEMNGIDADASKSSGADPENIFSSKGKNIKEQTFTTTLMPLGEVTFASYEPDLNSAPLADVVFLIEKDGKTVQQLPGMADKNCRANESFNQVEAVSFLDYNKDGFDDIITVCSYSPTSGPEVGTGYSEIRYYTGSENGTFNLEKKLSQDANSALAVHTIQSAKNFIGIDRKPQLKPWQQAYLSYLHTDSVPESLAGYTLIYLDEDEIPELVEVGICEAEGCHLINYSHDSVHITQLERLYFTYIERGNQLCNSEGLMDNYYDLIYSIVDGKMELTDSGYYGAWLNSNIELDENGKPVYRYKWNGIEVDSSEYERELNKVYDSSKAKRGYDVEELYTLEEITAVLESL